jgi:hypothetical protein
MKLCDTGHFFLEDDVAKGLINGDIFGLNLKLNTEEGGVRVDKPYRFCRDEGNSVVGTIDIGNGQRRRLVAFFLFGHFAKFSYSITEIPEQIDSVHVMD